MNKNYEFNFQKLAKKYEFNFEKRLVTKNSDFILIKKYEIWYNCERIEKKKNLKKKIEKNEIFDDFLRNSVKYNFRKTNAIFLK